MPLIQGSRLGPYEVLSAIGAGGMGEVYRARDSKLNRDVALKILPEAFASDPERLARFRREAQVLASLNHPGIAAIYGFEDSGGTHALVLELVEGPTLADRIAQGPIPLDEALPIARQIAEALEAAHDQDIVHRDLKPANIKLRPDGTVKVLDFGLAKALEPVAASGSSAVLTNSPTLTSPLNVTGIGMLLGTAAYMSPEQAKGLRADHRSDVFSFGVVLYEMLSGRQAFPGETLSDVLAAVLAREPDFSALPSPLNPRLIELLKRCLEKQPRKRWQAVGDLRIELETVAAQPTAGVVTSTVASGRPFWRRAIPFAACAIAASLLTGGIEWTMLRQPEPPVMVTRFRFGLPESHVLTNQGRPAVAISPDGSKVVYVANGQLWVRSMGDLDPRPIAGTEAGLGGVSNPTFSPDGQSIAFGSGSDFTIKRAVVNGGPPITICPVRIDPTGMSWTGETIFYGQGTNGIMRVSANGGTPEQVVTVDDGWSAHGPQLLPGGEWLMFTLAPRGQQEGQIAVQSLTTGDRKVLIDGGAAARFQPTGSLVFARSGVLLAASLDLSRMEVAGKSVPVLEGVARAESTGAHYDVSATGVLAYRSGSAAGSYTTVLALVDRSGKAERLTVRPATYATPRAAPNGRQVAVVSEGQVWIHDLSGASSMRQLTFGGTNQHPVWSPDSQRIAFQSDREGDAGIFSQRADGSDTAIRLTSPEKGRSHIPSSWSSDGDTLLYSEHDGAEYVLWAQSLRDRKATPLDVRSVSPPNAIFRPDGRWIAYKALDKDPGSSVLFVQPFPSTGARYRIASPGNNPMWSADGKELVYGTGAGPVFQAVSITTHPSFAIGNPVPIPRGFVRGNPDNRDFDILPDGRRFVVVVDADDVTGGTFGGPEFVVVVNWAEELKRLVPTH